jgi:hypothetical protein
MHAVDSSGWPAWLQVVLAVAAGLGALLAIFAFVRKTWLVLNQFMTRSNMLDGLPRFIADTTETLAKQTETLSLQDRVLEKHGRQLTVVDKELNYNGETSTKDAIRRVELGVRAIYERIAPLEEGLAGLYPRMDKQDSRLLSADKDRDDLRHDLEEARPKPIRKRTTKPKETP